MIPMGETEPETSIRKMTPEELEDARKFYVALGLLPMGFSAVVGLQPETPQD